MIKQVLAAVLSLSFVHLAVAGDKGAASDSKTFVVVVMDPLALPLSCPCVEGYAQRDYDKLGKHLEQRLGRPVKVVFSESLKKAVKTKTEGRADLVIGKRSVVEHDAKALGMKAEAVASLVDKTGKTTQHGIVVVPMADPAQNIADLKNYRIIFGPAENDEKSKMAIKLFKQHNVSLPEKLETKEGCADGALAILEAGPGERGACVISSYAAPLLEGCGTVKKGALRVVGITEPVPFVTAFATEQMDSSVKSKLLSALEAVKDDAALLKALESQSGFAILKGSAVAKKN